MQIARLLFIKTEIKQVYKKFWNRIIHRLCSIIFFVRWSVKKLSTGGRPWGMRERSEFCPRSVIQYLLVYPSILLGYPSNNHTYMPSICSLCWFLLFIHFSTFQPLSWKVMFRHSKSYSSHSFQPTGIGLGSLWRENKCVSPFISDYL